MNEDTLEPLLLRVTVLFFFSSPIIVLLVFVKGGGGSEFLICSCVDKLKQSSRVQSSSQPAVLTAAGGRTAVK